MANVQCLLILICLLANTMAWSQVQDSSLVIQTPVDSSTIAEKSSKKGLFLKKFWKDGYPSPKKAALLSLALPGTGQIYNKKYWKLPLVYGGIAGLVFLIDTNNAQYQKLRQSYRDRTDEDLNNDFLIYSSNVPTASILSLRNKKDKNLQQLYVGFFFLYIFNAIDAFVDGHLNSFDVDENISLQIKPTLETSAAYQTMVGIGFQIQF